MKTVAFGIAVSFVLYSQAGNVEKQLTKKEYTDIWRNTAIDQMIQYKIPASITLAQAILESGSGNSELATKGNNHFGIKCHDWKGETMHIDDDQKGECFRVYANAQESYVDHSKFLAEKKRYNALFTLEMKDYKSWAKGLKDAGYATNPKYPELLIGIIEDLKLHELDVIGTPNNEQVPTLLVDKSDLAITKHTVVQHENKVKYIIAKKGDTYYRISKEFGLGLWQLYRYNDFGSKKDVLEEGDVVYIQPKRKRSKTKIIQLTESMTLREISQAYAIKLESLVKHNENASKEEKLPKGEKVALH